MLWFNRKRSKRAKGNAGAPGDGGPEEAFTTDWQLAALLGIEREVIGERIASGELPATRVGNEWHISDKDSAAFMDKLTKELKRHTEELLKEKKALEKQLRRSR